MNTCVVTEKAEKKSRSFIRQAKKKNPKAIVAAVGCYTEIHPDEIANLCKYLISEEAKGITGQSINLCAGISLG